MIDLADADGLRDLGIVPPAAMLLARIGARPGAAFAASAGDPASGDDLQAFDTIGMER